MKPEHMSALVSELKANDTDHLHQLLGEGDITVTQLVQAAERLTQPEPELQIRARKPAKGAAGKKKRGSLVEIEGIGDLPITLARCCAPIRPQAITGYVTLGRGVTYPPQRLPGTRAHESGGARASAQRGVELGRS